MSKHLLTNPNGVFFREAVVTGNAYLVELYLLNTGNANLSITDISFATGTRFTWLFPTNSPTQVIPTIGTPWVLLPLTNYLILLTFDPTLGEEDTENTDTLTITHDGDNTPNVIDVSGWNRPAGNPRLKFSPSSWSFDWVDGRNLTGGTPFGQLSNVVNMTLGNTGDKPLTITGLDLESPALIMDPKPSFPIVLAPNSGYTFHFALTAQFVGTEEYDDIIGFFTDAPTSPDYFVVTITGLAITSAYNLTGAGLEPFLSFTSTIRQVTLGSYDTEETTSFKRVYALSGSGIYGSLSEVRFKYEDWGVATVNVQAKTSIISPITGTAVTKSVNANVSIGSAGADTYVKDGFVSLQVEGELIEIQFSRTSGHGRVVITEIMPIWDENSELTALGNLPAVVSAYNVTGTPLPFYSFGSTIRQLGTSLDTEEAGSIVFQRNLNDPGNEKTLSKVLAKYEDLGAVTVTVTDVTKRQTVGPITLNLGNITSDGFVYPAEFDLIISDELHKITIARAAAAGPLSIVELIPSTAQRGVTVKEP